MTVVVIFVKKLFKIFFLYGRLLLPGERARRHPPRRAQPHGAREQLRDQPLSVDVEHCMDE